MGTRVWVRDYQEAIMQPNSGFDPTAPEIPGYSTSPDNTATVVRCLLDIECKMIFNDESVNPPIQGWWNYMYPAVAIGRDISGGYNPLNIGAGQDSRIIGTAGLSLATVVQTNGLPYQHTASFRLLQTLDTHGMRRALPGPGLNLINLTVQIFPLADVFSTSLEWTVVWFGYLRVLWDIP